MTASRTSTKFLALWFALTTALLFLGSCSSGPQDAAYAQAALPRGPGAQTIVIRGLKFQPAVMTVKVGDTVQWKNEDIVPHNAVSTEAKEFNSGNLAVGDSWKYQAAKKGTFFYACTLHPNMKAKLVVQ